jgi:hypothetical protein
MKEVFRMKTWAGPLTIGSFVVMAATGILMFFHLNVGAVKLVHEWLSWLLVIGAVAHLAVNWRPFLGYFQKPVGVGIMATVLLLGAFSLFPAGGPPRRPPFMEALMALEQSSLNVVAQVAKRSPQSAVDELRTRGLHVAHKAQTISEIALDKDTRSMDILAYVFGRANGPTRTLPNSDATR